MNKSITVIGSTNTDMVIQTHQFPHPGETVIGKNFVVLQGGKGANQAVAASRLGGKVTFVSMLGKDDFAQIARKGFQADGIETKFVYETKEKPTGVAFITINHKGQNSIVVSPGANQCLGVKEIDSSMEAFAQSSIVLVQLEIPISTVAYVLKIAAKYGKNVILNPAPSKNLELEIYSNLYLITPNETEASELTGVPVNDVDSASEAADIFLVRGVKNVIITLGDKGAYFKNSEESFLVPAQLVETVDTTAAGDIFNGALAVALSEGNDWRSAIEFANKAASIGVGKLGAQASIPFRSEVDKLVHQ
ncbi:ribokinase [uncultured Croceitalea sp.]|uniref:ribokinase n=1 Tax=uncultured Croceitalea sp. TaxID=1798908 RepID=UPI00374F09DE